MDAGKSHFFQNFLFIITCLISSLAFGQVTELEIKPYLQDASPNSIKILWQTSSEDKSSIEWGATQKLGKKATGSSFDVNFTEARIHEVALTGLKRFTTYYYRIKTKNITSEIYQFKTPPFSSDNQSFKLVAMSDMQKDHNEPGKFAEIVNQGIIDYLTKDSNEALSDNLALVMIPGDLVENGTKYEQWQKDFFNPSEKLFSEVPVYPVLGNHEGNSLFYFKYFSLPKNGTPAFAEHWWYKDYGNTRIIGLNSNKGYRDVSAQVNWLKKLLRKTADNDDIDFVFAQLHHPHKSELWVSGEAQFTGEIIEQLEKFSSETGKPSIHFFGHTHGYSRGQSKNHKHVMINVASAGGAIDNWGEFVGKDYDEYTVTQDEYGFVVVEVDANQDDPKFTVKRISRGNTVHFRDNELRDSLTIWRKDRKPVRPEILAPNNETLEIIGNILKASPFQSDMASAIHGASQWQIATKIDFKKPKFDSWKQHENWYYLENRQKDDDLTDEKTPRLRAATTYYVRVRYRDQHLNWSDWSEPKQFKTK